MQAGPLAGALPPAAGRPYPAATIPPPMDVPVFPGGALHAPRGFPEIAGDARMLRPPSRARYYVLFLAFMVAGGGGAYAYLTRPGKLQLGVTPLDARLLVNGVELRDGPPYVIAKRPGAYHLAASKDGYVPKEQRIEIRAGQFERMQIELDASPETGFELTSQPPGGLVWLDGQPFTVDDKGKQAATNFRAYRIAPGRHVIEIKNHPRFKDWRQEIFQEPGQTLKIHAELEPVVAGSTPVAAVPTQPPPATSSPTPTVPALPVATASPDKPAPREAGSSGRGSPGGRRETGTEGESAHGGDGPGGTKPAGKKPSRPVAGDDVFAGVKPAVQKPSRPVAGDDVFAEAKPAGKKPSKPVAGDDVFAEAKPAGKKPSKPVAGDDVDVFENEGKTASAKGGEQCTASISSKPWAEVAIDGTPTGKNTPLIDYSMPCGKHRITFTNPDLMIERNESITLKPGKKFKKTFTLVDTEL
jgi:hypothetical protein